MPSGEMSPPHGSPDPGAPRGRDDSEERDDGAARPLVEPRSLRTFSERPAGRKGPRDVMQVDRVQRLRVLAFSLVGGLIGFLVGIFLVMTGADFGLGVLLPPLAGLACAAVTWALVSAIVGGAGRVGGTLYAPSGSGLGPPRREYSLAESFAARGRWEDAVSAFQLAVAEHPDDPTPYLRVARICRDHLEDPERAERWFVKAREEADTTPGQERLVSRELVELYRKGDRPRRAAPELARLAELHPDTPEGEWAREELAEIKREIAEEHD